MIGRIKNLLLGSHFKYFQKSYSQCGEDLLINYVFQLRGIAQPTYIDIGANHPFLLSNTALFYKNGCRGINIDANPNLIKDFLKHRPKDINLNIGIGSEKGKLDFYIMNDPTLSSFSKEECANYCNTGKYFVKEVKPIEITTIENVLHDYFNGIFPDFLSLDAEGLDFDILKTIDYQKNFPKVICVEAAEYSPIGAGKRRTELIDFLASKGYYEYANTNLNAIMVKNEFWFI
jgi:FkbM family methyltransferase